MLARATFSLSARIHVVMNVAIRAGVVCVSAGGVWQGGRLELFAKDSKRAGQCGNVCVQDRRG